mgnify:CR=1 FL=1
MEGYITLKTIPHVIRDRLLSEPDDFPYFQLEEYRVIKVDVHTYKALILRLELSTIQMWITLSKHNLDSHDQDARCRGSFVHICI